MRLAPAEAVHSSARKVATNPRIRIFKKNWDSTVRVHCTDQWAEIGDGRSRSGPYSKRGMRSGVLSMRLCSNMGSDSVLRVFCETCVEMRLVIP